MKEDGSPLFLLKNTADMDANQIIDALQPVTVARELKVVKVKITKNNDITVTIDSLEGNVTLDDCVEVNRAFTGIFDQDKEDYSLTVTSPGVGRHGDEDDDE